MAKVLIGCKLPNGLIMELVKPGAMLHPAPRGEQVKLNGANTVRIARFNPAIGGYGVTSVDDSFASKWFLENAKHPAVESGAVFIAADTKQFEGESKDRTEIRTGLEPLDPSSDGRNQAGVEADGEHLKRLRTGTR